MPLLPAPAQTLFALLRGQELADADWDAVSVYALATGLGPIALASGGAAMPPLVAARLRLAGRRTEARNRVLMDALATILHGCAAAGLPVICLKGAHLAPALYGDLSLRGMTDLDLLVQPQDLSRLQGILVDLGYQGKFTSSETGIGRVKHEWTYKMPAQENGGAHPYVDAGDSFHVEPHTSLTEVWFGLRVDVTPGVWERAIPREWRGAPACVLCAEDNLLYLAVHLVFHLLMGRPALVQLYDLRLLLERQADLDFDRLLQRAQAAAAAAHLLAALRLARDAYAAPVPDVWLTRLAAACPPGQRRQAEQIDLATMWRLTQQAPLTGLRQRLTRGVSDRVLAVRWARDWREAGQVAMTALRFYRTDTASLLRQRMRRRSSTSERS